MRRLALNFIFFVLLAGQVQAACYADYKAKKDAPLRLHYGVIELPESACRNPAQARAEVQARIARAGWTLLNVMSVFGEEGLNQRKESAADYFLRF